MYSQQHLSPINPQETLPVSCFVIPHPRAPLAPQLIDTHRTPSRQVHLEVHPSTINQLTDNILTSQTRTTTCTSVVHLSHSN